MVILSFQQIHAAESLTAFFSQKTNEIWEWQACKSASAAENQSLSSRFSVCLPKQVQRKTFDELSEKLFFDYAAQKQVFAYDCLKTQSEELLNQQNDVKVQKAREALAQDFARKIQEIRSIQKDLSATEDELAEMSRLQTTSPMGETFYESQVDERRQAQLRKRKTALSSAMAAARQSVWQSGNHLVQQRLDQELKAPHFKAETFISNFLIDERNDSLNFLLRKIQSQAEQDKQALMRTAADPKSGGSNYDLSDADRLRLYRDRNWILPESDQRSDTANSHFQALSCRLEGRYGQGRERFHHTVEVGSAVALTILPGGFYLAAGRGLISLAAARTLTLVSSSGIAATSLSTVYDQKCSRSKLRHSVQVSCSMPSKNLVQEIEDQNCALDIALAALDVPFPELRGASLAMAAGLGGTLKGAKSQVASSELKREIGKLQNPQIALWNASEAGNKVQAQAIEEAIRTSLTTDKLTPVRMVNAGKSGAFYVRSESGLEGIWKPAIGAVADAKSEIAVSMIDQHLGSHLVPITMPKTLNGVEGTLQLRVTDLKDENLESYPDVLGYFDYLIGNSDRHNKNYLVTKQGRLVAIDHGKAFDPEFTFTQRESLESHLETLVNIREAKKKRPSNPNSRNLDELEKRAYRKALNSAVVLTPPKEVVDRLRSTSPEDWKKLLGSVLTPRQIDGLVSRQREILEVIDQTEKVLGKDFYRSQFYSPLVSQPKGR